MTDPSPTRMERVLRVSFGSILAALSGAGVVACGNTQPMYCGGCGCNEDAFAPQSYDVTYVVCSSGDASTDADAAGDGGSADAGACFATCDQACETLKPVSISGFGTCLSPVDAGGGTTVMASCQTEGQACAGRKLDGLAAPTNMNHSSPLGAMFAQMAWLEAASVHAFRRLARELRAHGAPAALVSRAQACARDETRHARIMTRLAKKHGARIPHVVVRGTRAVRSLEEVARENAVEGCVGETYGALFAMWQETRADAADVARAMHAIAPDELRHAALGWAVAAWADTQLTPMAQRRVRAARDEATRALLEQTELAPTRELARALAAQVLAA